jgi:hypothetical protein
MSNNNAIDFVRDCLDWLYFVNAAGSSAGQLLSNGTAEGMFGHLSNLQQQCGNVYSPYLVQMPSAKAVDDALYYYEAQLRNNSISNSNVTTNDLADGGK